MKRKGLVGATTAQASLIRIEKTHGTTNESSTLASGHESRNNPNAIDRCTRADLYINSRRETAPRPNGLNLSYTTLEVRMLGGELVVKFYE